MSHRFLPLILLSACAVAETPAFARMKIEGQAALFGAAMPNQNVGDVTNANGGATLELDFSQSWGKRFRFEFNPWLQGDALTKSRSEKFQFETPKAAFSWRHKAQKLEVGISTMKWEGTDLINPMDLLHSKNFTDPLSSRTRGSPGMFYSNQIGNFSWDLAYIPRQMKAVLPGDNSPWWPRHFGLPVEHKDFKILLPERPEYRVMRGREWHHALDHNVGLRVQYHGDALDFSLAGFEGNSAMPVLLPDVTLNFTATPNEFLASSPIGIEPNHYRHRVAAAAAVVPVETWIFRLSGQYARNAGDDPEDILPSWAAVGVLAVEKPFSLGKREIRLILQGVASNREENGGVSVLSTLLKNSVMLGWRYPFTDEWTWTAAVFQELTGHSYFAHMAFNWNTSDRTKQELAGDLIGGQVGSALGTYERNDRIFLRSTFLF
jgi:hypothetical protein